MAVKVAVVMQGEVGGWGNPSLAVIILTANLIFATCRDQSTLTGSTGDD